MEPRLVGIREAAADLGVSKDTVRRLIKGGKVRLVRVSRRILIPRQEIDRICREGVGEPRRAAVPPDPDLQAGTKSHDQASPLPVVNERIPTPRAE